MRNCIFIIINMSNGNGIRTVSEEIQNAAHQKVAQVHIYNLYLLANLIDTACKRGAYSASESSRVGALYDILVGGINKSYDVAEEEIKKKEIDEIKIVN